MASISLSVRSSTGIRATSATNRARWSSIEQARALHAFDQHLDRAVGQLEHLQDVGQATDLVHVLGHRLILGGGLLGHQQDVLAGFHRRFQRLDRLRATDEQRNHHVREYHHVAQGQQRQGLGLDGGSGQARHHGVLRLWVTPQRLGRRTGIQGGIAAG
jgi:hypothetical protein